MPTTPTQLRFGTRGSDLARWQTDHVMALMREAHDELLTEAQVINTKGDQILDKPLPLVGGKGLFTAELEAALHNGGIDFAVHSLKDLPTEDPAGLRVGAIPPRENPADVLVSRSGAKLADLPQGARIGTSSLRRAAQLRYHRPDLEMLDIRGNLNTRLRKAHDPDGPYDAIVLAYAGLARLNMADVISEVFTDEQMLPAPGQGALGVQCRDDADSHAWLSRIHHAPTALAVIAERAFLAGLGGGCSVPVAAHARPHAQSEGMMVLTGRVIALEGSPMIEVSATFSASTPETARVAGHSLAQEAIAQGAEAILEALR